MRLLLRVAIAVLLTVAVAGPVWAVEGNEVALQGGTVSSVPAGTVGTLDLSSATAMVFRGAGKEVSIPYAEMEKVESTSEVARHLGVLPAIAVGLVRKRERRHFITLTYEDVEQRKQAVIFEVAKQRPAEILAVVLARAPAACGKMGFACRVQREY